MIPLNSCFMFYSLIFRRYLPSSHPPLNIVCMYVCMYIVRVLKHAENWWFSEVTSCEVSTAHAKVLNTICSNVCIQDYPVDTICSSWEEMGSRDEASRSNSNISELFLAQFLRDSTGPQCILLLLMQWSESVFFFFF